MKVSELKELAEKANQTESAHLNYQQFRIEVNPHTILQLIERVEKLAGALKEISEVKDYGDSLYQGIGIHPLKNQIALNALSLYGPDKELG
jgi:hypothetical protein